MMQQMINGISSYMKPTIPVPKILKEYFMNNFPQNEIDLERNSKTEIQKHINSIDPPLTEILIRNHILKRPKSTNKETKNNLGLVVKKNKVEVNEPKLFRQNITSTLEKIIFEILTNENDNSNIKLVKIKKNSYELSKLMKNANNKNLDNEKFLENIKKFEEIRSNIESEELEEEFDLLNINISLNMKKFLIKYDCLVPTQRTLKKFIPIKNNFQKSKKVYNISSPEILTTETQPRIPSTFELDRKHGHKINEIITNPYELAEHYQTIDARLYKQIATIQPLSPNTYPSNKKIKDTKRLLAKIENSWEYADYTILEPLKEIAEYKYK